MDTVFANKLIPARFGVRFPEGTFSESSEKELIEKVETALELRYDISISDCRQIESIAANPDLWIEMLDRFTYQNKSIWPLYVNLCLLSSTQTKKAIPICKQLLLDKPTYAYYLPVLALLQERYEGIDQSSTYLEYCGTSIEADMLFELYPKTPETVRHSSVPLNSYDNLDLSELAPWLFKCKAKSFQKECFITAQKLLCRNCFIQDDWNWEKLGNSLLSYYVYLFEDHLRNGTDNEFLLEQFLQIKEQEPIGASYIIDELIRRHISEQSYLEKRREYLYLWVGRNLTKFLNELASNTLSLADFSTYHDRFKNVVLMGITYGSPFCCYRLGQAFYLGLNDNPIDYKKAFKAFSIGAMNRGARCMRALGYCYYFGKGTKKSISKAVYWLSRALENGNPESLFLLTNIFENDIGDAEISFLLKKRVHTEMRGLFSYDETTDPQESWEIGEQHTYMADLLYARALYHGIGCSSDKKSALEIVKNLESKKFQPAIEFLKSVEGNSEKLICLDTETTGLSPSRDRICEIAAVTFSPITYEITSQFHVYLDPQCVVPSEVVAIHGLDNTKLSGQPKFSEIVNDFLNYIKNATIYIHNARFDVSMLNAELQRIGLSDISNYCKEIKCTLQMAKKINGPSNNSLDSLCDYYNIDRKERSKHGALVDSRLLVKVLKHLQE